LIFTVIDLRLLKRIAFLSSFKQKQIEKNHRIFNRAKKHREKFECTKPSANRTKAQKSTRPKFRAQACGPNIGRELYEAPCNF
jgi:hypothetical protein